MNIYHKMHNLFNEQYYNAGFVWLVMCSTHIRVYFKNCEFTIHITEKLLSYRCCALLRRTWACERVRSLCLFSCSCIGSTFSRGAERSVRCQILKWIAFPCQVFHGLHKFSNKLKNLSKLMSNFSVRYKRPALL